MSIDTAPPEPGSDAMADNDIRPVVERPRSGLSSTAIAAIAVVLGLILFGTLEARRRNASAPATRVQERVAAIAPLPPLYVPPAPAPSVVAQSPGPVTPITSLPPATPLRVMERQPVNPSPDAGYGYAQRGDAAPAPAAQLPARIASGSALILDQGNASTQVPAGQGSNEPGGASDRPSAGLPVGRVRAAMLANRSTTVPQGTLIPAVLETAFDSTHAGFARALVQRDIRGFDGSRILIPRGSRLIGEYGENVADGQRRAIILWTRLIRPDGATIALGSPATDTLGRGGMKADVNNHFFERFAGAILQSTFDLGISLAARSSNSPVVVALPGSIGGTGRASPQPAQIKPTLRVPAGRSVSVFVARDLDFTGMDTAP
ncbi:TrbI/VirB10 family protein [Sphingomonas adhaesiva]|uniref:TrbI/VirB10 family protein n=1 Tax=Sphingomonas adhaesiva TaxID=28212 RepID=UPI002FFA7E5C